MTNLFDRIDGDFRSLDIEKAANAFIAHKIPVLLTHGIDDQGNCTCRKKDCPSIGKHPIGVFFPKGHKSACLDKKLVARCLRKYPQANLAICPPPEFVVIDIDGDEGLKTYESLKLPKTATVKTGRGYHCYFQCNASAISISKLDGIDIKTSNGYVVVPPSNHHSGVRYKWLK